MSNSATEEQLPFHLPMEAAHAREDLVVTEANNSAVGLIDSWPRWPGSISILAGPVGAGKTHIAHVWASKAEAEFLHADNQDNNSTVPESGNYVVEDLVQGGFDEVWLFHLINSVKAANGYLLMTSRTWPADWGVTLPDLQSRLGASQLLELHEPDDSLLSGVLTKLFSDRQLTVDKSVTDYLVVRMERSLAFAQLLVDVMDRLSLSRQRPVTRSLAAEALSKLEMGM